MVRCTVRGAILLAALSVAAACANGDDPAGDPGDAGDVEDAGASRPPTTGDGTSGSDAGPSGSDSGSAGQGCTSKVVINELQCNGPNGAEFVELFNPGSCAIDLSGWQIAYRAASGNAGLAIHKFDSGSSISAGQFLLLANEKFTAAGTIAQFNGGGSLGNNGGQIGLLDAGGKLVDGVGYGQATAGAYTEGSPAPLPSGSASVGRNSDGVDTDANASDFETYTTPTPGVAN